MASKRGRNLLSQLSGVLRRIYFIDSLDDEQFKHASNFGIPISATQSLDIKLGYKGDALERIDDIADTLISNILPLGDGDRESFVATIRDTIQKSLSDTRVFGLKQIYGEANLFSILRSTCPIDSVHQLMTNIYVMLRESLCNWLTIFPLARLKSEPFNLGFDGISLIDPSDEGTWETIAAAYSNAGKWYGKERKGGKGTFSFPNAMWLVCELPGTPDGVRRRAAQRMRSFVSVLLSVMQDSPNVLLRVAPDIHNYAVQFPTKQSAGFVGEMHASIGPTFPAIAGDLLLERRHIASVRDWYGKRGLLTTEAAERYTAASQFTNFALNSDGLERFIYFFITLDALFGERGRVEERIRDGVLHTFPKDALWEYKIGRLFDLRSTIIHGGCVAVSEWEKIDSYKRHTKTMPEGDVATAAMTALLNL